LIGGQPGQRQLKAIAGRCVFLLHLSVRPPNCSPPSIDQFDGERAAHFLGVC
jgi:hypothetical protein